MKVCNKCKIEKDDSGFGTRDVNGKKYLRTQCRDCESKKRAARNYSEDAVKRASLKHLAKRRKSRASGLEDDKWIVIDARGSDRKKGRENDLDREFVRELIKDGCSYCGETEIRMTVDRVDNERGHLKDNVVPACMRCNYVRGAMPHKAWLFLINGMREAREKGFFGQWDGKTRAPQHKS